MTDYLKLAKQAMTKPDYFIWYGSEDMFVTWGYTGIARNRDSGILDNSNFESVVAHLKSEYGDEFDENFSVVSASHWTVGWVEQLIVKIRKFARCSVCDKRITFVETDLYKHYWDWVDCIHFKPACGNPDDLNDHIPAPFREDEITDYFKYVVDIAIDLRESYPIFDESDYSERESQAEYDYVDLVCKDNNYVNDDFDAGDVLSWLYDNGYSYSNHDSDGTPLWDITDLAIGVFMCHMEDGTEEFWHDWVHENSSWVIQRVEADWHKAGQEKMF